MSVSNIYCADKTKGCQVILVRHPESTSNLHIHENPHVDSEILATYTDADITTKGLAQQKKTVKYLLEKLVAADEMKGAELRVFSSPQIRASRVADSFCANAITSKDWDCDSVIRGLYYTVEPQLFEFRHKGKGELRFDDVVCCEESEEDFFFRVEDWKTRILEPACGSNDAVVLFGHSLFFSALTSACLFPDAHLKTIDSLPIHFPNASISVMIYNGSKWSLLKQGDVSHLKTELITGTHTHIY